ncbi:MAG: hypothetical protein A3B91_04745 [Candidatus Yanofskybacteria bacterium RIFCSPHIGHO2_02_FULL_41_29]|uniref:Uncharacterized protein n=1 Tax=Candidatus Yanofskybacteria bacterium RIFCSPHIGHO2_01_FULL_41_53 TaxID=1802663 RepID=A0A1F8EJM3_9BACT|nr:MAG: hypothetical protein A2650_04530 [Candidatus Yanofskybacteria bacterium RIFCSPHIGHO2_01_FULL_41_53]OGN11502.1 MAG: hypothetical protein A3B91_04745 [Candidatus Yanofskybacteria bacterium RIFCSPHIGHO2_02_FULL_41_29]OGN22612.1 MAG: hypothetical protein A2916_03140 [Candidatus Yanofskybacteria bacterium RIFCSPLOWO2_01_FULL_41_67]OGN29771.1 MAG: hypothetical protein A3H54_04310 [Candidatus Yanofskybacteria bacterium RIFCSPLOWO2_02_FULL_41_13]
MTGSTVVLVLPMVVAGACFLSGLVHLSRWHRERKNENLAEVFKFTSFGYLVFSVLAAMMIMETPELGVLLGATSLVFAFTSLIIFIFYRLVKMAAK